MALVKDGETYFRGKYGGKTGAWVCVVVLRLCLIKTGERVKGGVVPTQEIEGRTLPGGAGEGIWT